jgi:two-component system response regulator MprA
MNSSPRTECSESAEKPALRSGTRVADDFSMAPLIEVPEHPRVLVVDDDERTARLLARLLEQDGFTVDVETDGAAAIARLSRAPLPQLLVTDLRMPNADGMVVARCARAQSPAIQVFFVTSYPELLARLNDQIAPLAHVFSKPLAYPELTAAMRGSLNHTPEEKTS